MIRFLQDNPVGIAMASVCAGLLLIAVLLMVVWALPPSAAKVGSADDNTVASLVLPTMRDAGKLEDYDEIIARPVFNESRQPIIETQEDEEDADEEELVEDVDAPDVELAGVIITPSLRMATLRERGQGTSLIAFVGRPLEGPYGTWQVTSIEPREVMMASADGQELQLTLQVHNAKMAEPPKNPGPSEDPEQEAEQTDQPQVQQAEQTLSRAEEIRQRIAERREELKRAAESQQEGSSEPLSYQQAIQNMMGRKRRDDQNDEQEQ